MKEFEEVCSTCMDHTVNEDVIRLKLFPFSLKDKVNIWLSTLPPRSIGNLEGNANKSFEKILLSQ